MSFAPSAIDQIIATLRLVSRLFSSQIKGGNDQSDPMRCRRIITDVVPRGAPSITVPYPGKKINTQGENCSFHRMATAVGTVLAKPCTVVEIDELSLNRVRRRRTCFGKD